MLCQVCCCCSVTKLCPTLYNPWTAAHQAPLSSTISQSLLKFISIELAMLSNHLFLCHSLLLLLSIFPSIKVFSNELVFRIRWPKYRSFRLNPSNQYSGLISFRIDWFDLLSVSPRDSESLLQHHNSNHQFFGAQLSLWSNSHPYMTTRETIALTIWTFVGKVMSVLFVIAFLLRSRHLLVLRLQSPSAVIWEPNKRKSVMFPAFPHLFAMK